MDTTAYAITTADIERITDEILAEFAKDNLPEDMPAREHVRSAVDMAISEWVEDLVEQFPLYQDIRPLSCSGKSFEHWLEFYETKGKKPSVELATLHKV